MMTISTLSLRLVDAICLFLFLAGLTGRATLIA